MKWGGTKLYEVLESGVNEYGEIIINHFETSDNHRQLRPVLKILQQLGLNPSIVFSDVPQRDKRLLEEVFPSLKEGVQDSVSPMDLDDEGLDTLPLRGEIQYVDTLASATAALQLLQEQLNEVDIDKRVVSLDPEWPVFDGGSRRGKISVISLASPVMEDVVVIHVARIHALDSFLRNGFKALLSREDVAFVG